jgi:hypothetical protein
MNWSQVRDISGALPLIKAGIVPSVTEVGMIVADSNTALMKFLIDAGVDIRYRGILAYSVISCTPEMVALLLDTGADPTADDNRAVRWAASYNDIHMVKVFVDHMQHSNICRYYYDGALYIHYITPPPDIDLLPGTSIWCSNPDAVSTEYVKTHIMAAATVPKSAYSG